MPDAALSTRPARKAARVLTAEAAQAKIVAKLAKAGAKGTAALHPAKISDVDRTTYAGALASLEAASEVFADRRKPKPKFYQWDVRPVLPSAESVADDLDEFAQGRFPVLTNEADFKKALGKEAGKKALLPAALALLVEDKRLVVLTQRAGKKETRFYISATAMRDVLGGSTPQPVAIPTAYAAVFARTGFPAVMISEILRVSGAELPALHQWLVAAHRGGRAVLSLGDWSLASAGERAAALEMHGERYLQARLLP